MPITSLAEQYHPRLWSEVVGQDSTLRKLDCLRARCGTLAGRNYWLSGLSGTGKSTIADLIANEVAHPCCIHEIGGRRLKVDDVESFRREMQTRGFAPGGRVVIVNESHTLRKPVIEELLIACDQRTLPAHACWIFTTTLRGEKSLFEDFDDAQPLLSRCTKFSLETDTALPFAKRAKQIAQDAGLDGQPLSVYLALAKECENNLREMLNRIETGEFAVEEAAADRSPALLVRR